MPLRRHDNQPLISTFVNENPDLLLLRLIMPHVPGTHKLKFVRAPRFQVHTRKRKSNIHKKGTRRQKQILIKKIPEQQNKRQTCAQGAGRVPREQCCFVLADTIIPIYIYLVSSIICPAVVPTAHRRTTQIYRIVPTPFSLLICLCSFGARPDTVLRSFRYDTVSVSISAPIRRRRRRRHPFSAARWAQAHRT